MEVTDGSITRETELGIEEVVEKEIEEIISECKKVEEEISGHIYFLIKDSKIVYVGQSVNNLENRIRSHSKTKAFDSYKAYEYDLKFLNEIEASHILKFTPTYNKNVPKNKLFFSVGQIEKRIHDFVSGNNVKVKNNLFGNINITFNMLIYYIIQLEIKKYLFNGVIYIKSKDYKKILNKYLEEKGDKDVNNKSK